MTKKLLIFLSAAATVLAGLYFWQRWQRKTPTVVSFSPPAGAIEVAPDSQIEIVFRSAVKIEELSFQVTPELAFQVGFGENQSIIILAPEKPLTYQTTYNIRIIDQRSRQTIAQWSFSTAPGQGDPQLKEEIDEFQTSQYPLLPFSPPNNASFYFTYTGPLQLKVFLKGIVAAAKEETLQWIASIGVDPNSHQIEWVTPGP